MRQRVEFVPPATTPSPYVEFEVRRNDELVLLHYVGQPSLTRDVWLAPGSYTLTTHERKPASVQFTVGAEEKPPLRVELR